jgi:hypothetical protein
MRADSTSALRVAISSASALRWASAARAAAVFAVVDFTGTPLIRACRECWAYCAIDPHAERPLYLRELFFFCG